MAKNEKIQTTTVTETTVTITDATPVNYMPINKVQEPGTEKFYKQKGIKVREMYKFGKYRTYALVPVENYETASEEEKVALKEKAEAFSRSIDNHRRNMTRATEKYLDHEVTILSSMMECGYDPAIDSDKPLHDTTKKVDDAEKNDDDLSKGTVEYDTSENFDIDNTENDDCSSVKATIRHTYNPSTDINNPEYIVAKNILYSKMYAMIDELEGEDLEIVKMIMTGSSERQLARDLGIKPSTLQYHRAKLMARFKEALKNDYEN